MEKAKVSVVYCDNYEKDFIYTAVKTAVNALGGIQQFVNKKEKILVKPNFLYPSEAEKAITTHPTVIRAVLKLLSEAECTSVKVGDSPANGTSKAALGKTQLSEEDLFGATMAEMNEEVLVPFPQGHKAKDFYFAKEVTEAEAIIGVCKMKTHALERITGAVKNMFGLVCGKRKAACHVKYPTASDFAKMLTDIHRATPQRLHIMDAVVAMEGNGPASGNPIPMNLILVSSDPVAIDTVFSRLVYLDPGLVPTNVMGEVACIGTMREENIEILLNENGVSSICDIGTLVQKYGKPKFDVLRVKENNKSLLGLWSKLTGGSRKPMIDPTKCVKCGVCVEHCPVEGKGVRFANGKDQPPVYDYDKCIRCYCCQELCPQHAIKAK